MEDELKIAAAAFETNDAIMITDAQANIIRVNQAFVNTTGYSFDEVRGKNPKIMSSGIHDKSFYEAMWKHLISEGAWSGEIYDKRKNGEIYPKWLKITTIKDDEQRVTNYVAIFSDLSEKKRTEEEIRNLSFYDSTTNLPNRHLFLECFRSELSSMARHNSYGAVLFIDLDRFKTLNDTLGHDYGDLMLIQVATRLKNCVRTMDTVARLGGDEFVVLVKSIGDNQEEAVRKVGIIAEKVRESLAAPYNLKGHQYISSPSIGISLYCGSDGSVDTLLQQADIAMFQAKNAGRNAIRFFDPVMQHKVTAHAALENDLRHAVTKQQFQLHYQLQVGHDHRPIGAEALLRWHHPQHGLLLPATFIQIAEESSLIVEIGDWVLDTACRQLARWSECEKTRHLTLSVNVSAKQIAQFDFVDKVAQALKAHDVMPAKLKLELTESMMLENLDGTVSTMKKLKSLGVILAMDDFGIGYSSLAYLKRMPLDQLKIDQGFVSGITADSNDAVLVQTIIDLAANFKLNVIAEGVETEAQLTFLKHHDCLAYQGHLFAKAVPIEEFECLIR